MDLSQQLESEQRRLQERSQIAHLQGQLDELRHQFEQQSARSQLASEQARQVQELFNQIESRFEAQLGEARLQEQTRLRSYQALQKEVAELRLRVEEPARQILALMAQVQDLQDSIRLLREQLGRAQEESAGRGQEIDQVRAQELLLEERLARLDSLVSRLLQGEDERHQMVQQLQGQFDSERQNLRRQAGDVERLAADLRGEGQELLSRLNRLADLQRQDSAAREAMGERFDDLEQQIDRLAADVKRVEREAVERFLHGQERLEDLRRTVQREGSELRKTEERREESQNAWLRRIEELYHGLDERIARKDEETGRSIGRLEGRLGALERGGESLLRALMDFFQDQMEQGVEERLKSAEPLQEEPSA